MTEKGVSFVIASYNCAPFIDECLASVFQQDYNGDIEIVVCDDCSTDNSKEILQKYADNQKIVLLQNSTNIGAASSRNRCINAAKYDYIAILDADDYISTDRIRVQMKALEQFPEIDFVSSGIQRFYEDGEKQDFVPTNTMPKSKDFLKGIPFSHATTVFTKKCLMDVNGYRISWETQRGHDYDLFMRLYAKGYRGMTIPNVLYYYRCFKVKGNRDKYKYRIGEAIIRYKGFKALHLGLKSIPYIVKPLLVGLLPKHIILKLQSK